MTDYTPDELEEALVLEHLQLILHYVRISHGTHTTIHRDGEAVRTITTYTIFDAIDERDARPRKTPRTDL